MGLLPLALSEALANVLKWFGAAVALLVVGPLALYAWRHRWK